MYRNTVGIIVFLAIFAALVVGTNIGRRTSVQEESIPTVTSPTPSIFPTPAMIQYTSQICGIAFSYPDNFTKVDIQTGGVTLANRDNPSETVVALCQTGIPRVPLPDDKIEAIKIGTASGAIYHDASQNDGSPIDKLIFVHPKTRKDVYIAGYGDIYQQIISTLKLYP